VLTLRERLRRFVVWKFGLRRIPLRTPHFELSVISPLDESPGRANAELLDLAVDVARMAAEIDLSQLHDRSGTARRYLSVFPGEHYHLLAALVRCMKPSHVTEIGTFTGLSALAILSELDGGAKLTTYDLVPWDEIPESALRPNDFASGQLEQRLGDLANPETFTKNVDVLLDSQLIFVDGPKDRVFEPAFLKLITTLARTNRALLVFDDIRLWNMLGLWADLVLPKLDMTSFGHWSGTGFCWLDSKES
jgi:predicted O-methyltransferase YrrM